VYRTLVEKPEARRSLRKTRLRYEVSIQTDVIEIRSDVVDRLNWVCGGPIAGSCEHGNKLSGSIIHTEK
jgi:hypothetical protein